MPTHPNNEIQQKYQDVLDVFVRKIRPLSDFAPEYQRILLNAYRFNGLQFQTPPVPPVCYPKPIQRLLTNPPKIPSPSSSSSLFSGDELSDESSSSSYIRNWETRLWQDLVNINVLKTKKLSDFSVDYQIILINFFRYSGIQWSAPYQPSPSSSSSSELMTTSSSSSSISFHQFTIGTSAIGSAPIA